MSSLTAYSPAVPSCSGSGAAVKRRHDSDSDSSGTAIKIPKGNFYIVLESESDISSSDDGTESFTSLQNKSTDFARDTSDTSSKTSHNGSDFEVEYEVVSLSEEETKVPFDGSCSGTDLETLRRRPVEDSASDASDSSMWADNSSGSEEAYDKFRIPARLRFCVRCKQAPTCVHYCTKCYKVRKDFFPPRPKLNKRKKVTRFLLKKKCSKEPPKTPVVEDKNESGIDSGCSQELLTPEEESSKPVESENLCNICFKNQKDGAFVHCRWVHIYACYECSVKTWFTSRRCPLCNGKVNKVLKVATG
ncbi:E3 ubiquitin-protein ligase Mdm2-like [Macrosteles quadrilineatus]|uniref:E3 ubiquitin-protein ligase Mdm2-like n=1 Tax=Macrosteles quadrilineatus TaxID=74068 RepID=UPI0023E14B9A|nr:E3 ubiquitin-protein ligase Mdm2-like [Macrosteles quadrilineatus]